MENRKQFENANFLDDREKMIDFHILTKDEFLKSYSYITENEYDNTYNLYHSGNYYLIIKEGYGAYFNKRFEVWDLSEYHPVMLMWSSERKDCEDCVARHNHKEKPKRAKVPFNWMEG